GRFDRQVTVSLPDIKEREAILAVHASKIPMDKDVDLSRVARSTPGMSGAELASLVNEAALFAAGKNIDKVSNVEFEEARDKLLMGVARETMVMPEKEKRMTACHEAGHAIPYYYLEHASPLHKVSIIPRGRALGVTVGIPEEDSYSHTKTWLEDQLVILYGGYAAESLIYADTTTGTQNDIMRATEIARKMVCEWGMSSEMGAVSYGQEDEPIFMGRDIGRHKMFSDETACKIDIAVSDILKKAYDRAYSILQEHKDQLEKLTEALVERETMSDAEIRDLLCFEPYCKTE
ncbi:MAG: cell division protein FtsH, partial [Spirochaetaceae bacterium]|nr:cell division protein FtsH [Spirochaetaceae bacterium]